MGTGKSSVARVVAQRLGFACLDSDHEIERGAGRTIPEIFAGEGGEAEFRRLERAFVEGGHPPRGTVVACGGGLAVQTGMAALLRARGVVVCLHASIASILERTARQTNRPLLNVPDREARVRELYAQREPIYRSIGTLVMTDGRSLRDVAAHVERVWRREAPAFARPAG